MTIIFFRWVDVKDCCQDVPYHRFHHGVDVLFTVFRLLQITHAGDLEASDQEKHLGDDFFCREVAKKNSQPSVSFK